MSQSVEKTPSSQSKGSNASKRSEMSRSMTRGMTKTLNSQPKGGDAPAKPLEPVPPTEPPADARRRNGKERSLRPSLTGFAALVQAEASELGSAPRSASDVQRQALEAWEASEDAEPTNPFQVLGIHMDDPAEKVQAAYKEKMLAIDKAGAEETSPSKVLSARMRRAHAILSDPARRKAFETRQSERIAAGTLAKLRYGNGLYEGGIAFSPASGSTAQEPIRSGKGRTLIATGEKHEGEYDGDVRHGVGLCFWSNGDLYLGSWRQDKMDGQGCLYYANGSRYSGEFKEGLRHGVGFQQWADGTAYSGDFVEGKRDGYGVLELPMNSSGQRLGRYEGQWKAGTLDGHGQFTGTESLSYEGDFKASTFHGRGRLLLPRGDSYTGSFNHGRREGDGIYSWRSGDSYSGAFRANMMEGEGSYWSASRGFDYRGQWQANQASGKGTLHQDHADEEGKSEGKVVYVGHWQENQRDGRGMLAWPSGTSYEGQFRGGLPHGIGTLEWPSGSTWSGTFANGVQGGAGLLRQVPEEWQPMLTETVQVFRDGKLEKSHVTHEGIPSKRSGRNSAPLLAAHREPAEEDPEGPNMAKAATMATSQPASQRGSLG